MKVLFITNIPSPYRMDFFNELGQQVELTVAFERETAADREKSWLNAENAHFRRLQLNTHGVGNESSIGWIGGILKRERADILIFDGYSSPTAMLAIAWCRMTRTPYWISSDGAFPSEAGGIKQKLKNFLIGGAAAWLSTSKLTDQALIACGARQERIFRYPFTSIRTEDILDDVAAQAEKEVLRQKLDIPESKMVVTVGQFIPRKGFDVLLRSITQLPGNVGFYFIGGQATEEYTAFVQEHDLKNVHFIGFKSKPELKEYYLAADLFVLPTREDIWGLVVNEAMACGLPVVSTQRCMAALELVTPENGALVPVEDDSALAAQIRRFLTVDCTACGRKSLEIIRNYTIESMAEAHVRAFAAGNKE